MIVQADDFGLLNIEDQGDANNSGQHVKSSLTLLGVRLIGVPPLIAGQRPHRHDQISDFVVGQFFGHPGNMGDFDASFN